MIVADALLRFAGSSYMTSGLVINVEHESGSRTELFTGDSVTVRPGADADLPLPAALPIEIYIERRGDVYAVTRFESRVPLLLGDGSLVAGASLRDGDLLRSADDSLRLRFFPVGVANAVELPARRHTGELRRTGELTLGAPALSHPPAGGDAGTLVPNLDDALAAAPRSLHVAPFMEDAALEAAATTRRDDAKVFLREFTRELVREISPVTKIITLLIASALVAGVIYFPYAYYKELQRNRRENEALRQQLATVSQALGATRNDLNQLGESNTKVIDILTKAPQIVAKYSNGVCLIAGTYQWYEQGTNKPLRYRQRGAAPDSSEDEMTAPAAGDDGEATLTTGGSGAVAQFDFVGTGFHVGGGYVLTNRHVAARPWEADPRSQYLTGTVPARARITRLVAFFPNQRQPLLLRLRAADAGEDLAVCTTDPAGVGDIPVLPLDADAATTSIGNDVVMIGFPSGPDRLLSLLDETEARIAQARYGSSVENLVGFLASRSLVRPLTTRGTITDLLPRRIVYDARTAEGGSGAPLFGESGNVIGVNYAVLTANSASNLAVPVRFARELLARAGWRPPAEAAPDDPDAADDTNKAAANQSGDAAGRPATGSAAVPR